MSMELIIDKYGIFVIIFFAIIGILHIFSLLSLFLMKRNKCKILPKILLLVKNAQNEIEGIIRNLVNMGLLERVEEVNVMDLGSEDETVEILNRLSEEIGINITLSKEGVITEAFNYPYIIILDLRRLSPCEVMSCLLSNFKETSKIRTNFPEILGP